MLPRRKKFVIMGPRQGGRLRKVWIAVLGLAALWTSCPRPPRTLYTIGVLLFLESPTTRDVRRGFINALETHGLREGVNVRLDVRDGLGDLSEVQRTAQAFVRDGVDMILAVSTPCLQAAMIATQKIPIIFTSVANPYLTRAGTAGSGHLDNVTGVASTGPIKQSLMFIKEVLPATKRVGTLWTPSELNSEYYLDLARTSADALGLEIVAVPVANPNEVLLASQVLINKSVDAIYQISDNTVNASFEALGRLAEDNGVPLFGGFLLSTHIGACAALGWDFFDMGFKAGEIAVRVRSGESAGRIPFQSMTGVKIHLNLKTAEKQGVKFPPEIIKRAAELWPSEKPAAPAGRNRN
jgi:putative tryptophan/tyrosine transport system substrate-binding protein